MTYELQCIISGKSQVRYGTNIQAAISYLETSEASGSLDKTNKHFKREETEKLKHYIDSQKLWIKDIDLNNYFFPDTAYNLLEFFENENILYAIVEQSFINATEKTDLKHVEQFMNSNGFQKIRNNDYFNSELGIILEDLHDENVLTSNEILYFIDTVFYLK